MSTHLLQHVVAQRYETGFSRAELQTEVLCADETEAALALWRQLEVSLPSPPLSATADWVQTWIEQYGRGTPCCFLVGRAAGGVVGLALLTSERSQKFGPLRVTTGHFGTAGETGNESVCVEYNEPLVRDEFSAAFLDRVVSQSFSSRVDRVQWDGITPEVAKAVQRHCAAATLVRRPSPYFDLTKAAGDPEKVLPQLGRSTRSNLRRRLKQYGDLRCEWADDLDEAHGIFGELISLHQARWTAAGQPGAFTHSRFLQFQRNLITRLHPQQRCVLWRVRQGEQTVGCLFLLVDRGRLLDYISGLADFSVCPSGGLITHYLCMSEAVRRGYRAYDFLVGEHRHKQNLSTDENELIWLHAWKRTPKGLLAHWGARARRAFIRRGGDAQRTPPME